MLICDAVWSDPWTGKKTLIGTFSHIVANAFPLAHPFLAVFLALADARGKFPVKVRLVGSDEDAPPLMEVEAEVSNDDPRAVVELVLNFNGVVLPAPGEYRLQAHAANEFLIERRLLAVNRQESSHLQPGAQDG
jgi:hypothetical protein